MNPAPDSLAVKGTTMFISYSLNLSVCCLLPGRYSTHWVLRASFAENKVERKKQSNCLITQPQCQSCLQIFKHTA